jgi:hypothetical protein
MELCVGGSGKSKVLYIARAADFLQTFFRRYDKQIYKKYNNVNLDPPLGICWKPDGSANVFLAY